ncbi:protein-methionine-sulfoxide reductase heme-binding subunit MsrQ [Marinobacterium nitratireducens]|uniref:Protein-methionine-sulfoxide reductase heme-binding subunit MsrQ n=1 Tax=Marinobacterium nitratireducens TaxID=518897 RepID=A0A918DWV3_9GAMM|nr:protein-methionine-sulfoxide reductase heme-binding subunit MsrQ [Marinobacterium nitratireducens]GGO88203.1 protein-methionine-sulfoxide reductase heme-binding subunit MsrQ [Marinobacterium nitratireducens]
MVLTPERLRRLALWWLVFLLPLLPLAWLVERALAMDLGADPAQAIVQFTGIWTLRLLFVTLAVTPLRLMFRWAWLQRYRRMFGLYTLFYAVVHLLAFATFILGWRPDLLLRELSERPYIIVGTLALLLLIPLGVTSTRGMQRRLGPKWAKLHRLVYLIALLAMLHFIWQIRSSFQEQLIYGLILAWLLGFRLWKRRRRSRGARRQTA